MKVFYRATLFLIVMAWSSQSLAAEWVLNRNVKYLYAGEVGDRYAVKLTGIQPNPDACMSANDLLIESSNPKLKEMWSLLLAAYMANNTVNLYLSGCGTGTYNKIPVVKDISLGGGY